MASLLNLFSSSSKKDAPTPSRNSNNNNNNNNNHYKKIDSNLKGVVKKNEFNPDAIQTFQFFVKIESINILNLKINGSISII